MKNSILPSIRNAADLGSIWIYRNARQYGLHEAASAILHYDFCQTMGFGSDNSTGEFVTLQRWLCNKQRSGIIFSPLLRSYLDTTFSLLLPCLMMRHGMSNGRRGIADNNWYGTEEFRRSVSRIKSLDTAADYFAIAFALRLLSVEVDARPIFALQRELPAIQNGMQHNSIKAIGAFNYCTHAAMYETRMLRDVNPIIKSRKYLHWLINFWKMTRMQDDVEMLSEFLNCIGVSGSPILRGEAPSLLRLIVSCQHGNGCWRGSENTTRYERFHTTWRATEALYLSSRLLSD